MAEKIFLEKNRNIESVNKDSKININLTQKARLLPFDTLSDKLNLSDLYNDERDSCEKYRLIFTVNPVCTNVLFNMKTEVLKDEGSKNCASLVGEEGFGTYSTISKPTNQVTSTINPIDHLQAIRDSEYTHPNAGKLVYHCGLDMFNNHMLRSREFVHINKLKNDLDTIEDYGSGFNTIFDYLRDDKGEVVNDYITDSPNTSVTKSNIHVYRVDNVYTMEEAYNEHMKEVDGWFGFKNVGFIEIPNGANGTISVNKLMNNNKACEFIDMYPDRSLYSFIPKLNRSRQRIERNWDYCITYPYYSDYDKFTEVMGNDSIKAYVYDGKTQNGYDLYMFKTVINHNIKYGDTVRLENESGQTIDINISGVGDVDGSDVEHCFRIYKNQLTDFIFGDKVWVRRLSNKTGCKYYFRRFKKILNYDGSELNSTIGKLAFGENIYGDRVAEVVYTDDINTHGLRDNLGRKLSEIYFTVIKTNRGHKKWYEENNFKDDSIEFSHCFGEITSGIDLACDDNDYNIRKLHNVSTSGIRNITLDSDYTNHTARTYHEGALSVIGELTPPKVLESDIREDNKDWFYGDIVEFDPSTNSEVVISKVYHRFNTAQRELCTNPSYFDLRYDKIVSDDYDMGVTLIKGETNVSYKGFNVISDEGADRVSYGNKTAQRKTYTSGETIQTYLNVKDGVFFPGNIQPEGYFYNPHHRVKIREISSTIKTSIGAEIDDYLDYIDKTNSYTVRTSNNGQTSFIEISTLTNRGYVVGDLFGIYDKDTARLIWGVLDACMITIEDNMEVFNLKIEVSEPIDLNDLRSGKYEIILTDGSVPTYSSYTPEEQKFVWRDIIPLSQTPGTSQLSEMMFTNGANYIHENVNFYVRRQDPFGKNGLLVPKRDSNGNDSSPLKKYKKYGLIFNASPLLYLAIESQNACL